MVSIAPNQFRIEGIIVSKRKNDSLHDFMNVAVRLEKVEHLFGPEAFLDPSLEEVEVSVANDLASSFKEGMHIRCSIRRAPGRFFAIPDSVQTDMKK